MKYHIEFDVEFKRNPYKGMYIALEGIDGSGKSTQLDRLYEYFKKQGKEVVKTREPRKKDGLIAKLVQEILQGKTKIPPVAFQYLFAAEREIHHNELVLPSLKEGKIVITDRCFWSAIPYGLLDKGESLKDNTGAFMLAAQSILSKYHQFTLPDYTFYLELPLSTAMKRVTQSHATEEKEIYEERGKIEKARKAYNWLLQKFPAEFIVIDSKQSVEGVTDAILERLQQ